MKKNDDSEGLNLYEITTEYLQYCKLQTWRVLDSMTETDIMINFEYWLSI